VTVAGASLNATTSTLAEALTTRLDDLALLYGGASWTTKAEADRVGRLLDLAPLDRLLDIGSGAGWPGF
jgi:hypothetical protein